MTQQACARVQRSSGIGARRPDLPWLLQALGENSVMQALMRSLDFLQGGKLALPLTFVSALVTSVSGKQFAAQFVAAGGASPACVQR